MVWNRRKPPKHNIKLSAKVNANGFIKGTDEVKKSTAPLIPAQILTRLYTTVAFILVLLSVD